MLDNDTMNWGYAFSILAILNLSGVKNAQGGDIPYLSDKPSAINTCNFVPNHGQITDQYGKSRLDIDFAIKSGGTTIAFGADAIHYQFIRTNNKDKKPIDTYSLSRLDMQLIGANLSAKTIAMEEQPYYENYYLTHNPDGYTKLNGYKKIIRQNIYPGIDWVLYITLSDGKEILKYDFIVHPGGNLADIRIKYKGDRLIQKLIEGRLSVEVPYGNVTEAAPVAYEASTGRQIPCRWKPIGNEWSYAAAPVDGDLIIDPALDWGTYFGGPAMENDDWPFGNKKVATDTDGNAYICGGTSSVTNIVTTGAWQTTLNGATDGFVAKFSSRGNLLWATYYGGEGVDRFMNLCVDKSGNAYVGGSTESTVGIATPNAWSATPANGCLVKFDAAGLRQWGSYYPISPESMTVDGNGNCYFIAKNIPSNLLDGMATPGTFIPTVTFNAQACLTKFNTNGHRIWGTFYKGSFLDIAVSPDNAHIYVSGATFPYSGATGIATPRAYQFYSGGNTDAFLAKFDTTGNRIWGTYFGGDGGDWGYGIALGPEEDIYMTGTTYSNVKIASPETKQVYSGGGDAFITRFDSSGKRIWGTYYGGIGTELASSVIVNSCGDACITGWKNFYAPLNDSIATPDALDTAYNGASILQDIIVAHFDGNSGRLNWGTYYGNNSRYYASSMIADSRGNFFIYGSDLFLSGSDLATPGAFKTASEFFDYWLLRWQEVMITDLPDTILSCDATIDIPYMVTDTFRSGNIFKVELSDTSGNFYNLVPMVLDSQQGSLSGVIRCNIPSGLIPGHPYLIRVTASNPHTSGACWRVIRFDRTPDAPVVAPIAYCRHQETDTLEILSNTSLKQKWFTDAVGGTPLKYPPVPSTDVPGTYHWYVSQLGVAGFCESASAQVTVTVKELPDAGFEMDTVICINEPVRVTAVDKTADSFAWYFDGAQVMNGTGAGPYLINWYSPGSYTVKLQTGTGGCYSDTTEKNITVNPAPVINAQLTNTQACLGDTITIVASGGSNYLWTVPDQIIGFTDNIEKAEVITDAESGNYIVAGNNEYGCIGRDTLTLSPQSCCDISFMPDAFSPDNDGRNDLYGPVLKGNLQLIDLRIYNRWGEMIFRSEGVDKKWDGTYKGVPVGMDTYKYYITLECIGGKTVTRQGDITVVR